ncbi:MAG: OmpA family protein [Bacteroidota bacterium]|nr:OmpA family protein [Bacteroidota bacterium]
MKNILFAVFFISLFLSSRGQENALTDLKDWELLGYAESAVRYGDPYSAIDYYSVYSKRNTDDFEISFKLGLLYFNIGDYQSAQPIFYKVYKNKPKTYPEALFRYAQTLKYEHKLDSAKHYFFIYKTEFMAYEPKTVFKYRKKYLELEMQSFSRKYNQHRNIGNLKVKLLNSTVNSFNKDFAPIILNDTFFVYSSILTDSIIRCETYDQPKSSLSKFYGAKRSSDEWLGGADVPEPFKNIENKNTSGGVFSGDKKRFYYSASKSDEYGNIESSLYVRKYDNEAWSAPEKLDNKINIPGTISTQPTIGSCYDKDLEVIYFVSNRKGGVGGSDIWYTVYNVWEHKYTEPVNAGAHLNTPWNELSPFCVEGSDIMYYSSDGKVGNGGVDIYKVHGSLVSWAASENIGKPYNSPYNDFDYVPKSDNKGAFLVSNRAEGDNLYAPHCCYDIFEIIKNESSDVYITGRVTALDNDNLQNFVYGGRNIKLTPQKTIPPNLFVELLSKDGNRSISRDTIKSTEEFKVKAEKGEDYLLNISADGFQTLTRELSIKDQQTRIVFTDSLTIIPVKSQLVSIKDIYFEYGQHELTEESMLFLDTTVVPFLRRSSELVLEVAAHTDIKGSVNYNLVLSKKRAESVVNYLVSKGVKRSRFLIRGYGESRPKYTDNDAGNRRIDFKILGYANRKD